MALLPPYTIYLTGVRTDETDAVANLWDGPESCPLGLLVQPLTAEKGYLDDSPPYDWVAIDNGAFTEIGQKRFNETSYLSLIEKSLAIWGDGVLFATAPDVAFKWQETLDKSLPFLPKIRRLGVPAALVLQNGATPDNIPWDECDAIFLGGGKGPDTGGMEWKVTPIAEACSQEALRRRKWVHMGRVNTSQRMQVALDFKCGSADGTYLMHETPFATAVFALVQVALSSAHRWARSDKPEDEVSRVVNALNALRVPPGRQRDQAVLQLSKQGLLKGRVKELIDTVNSPMLPGEGFWEWGKRKRDAMNDISADCAVTIAKERGESIPSVTEELASAGRLLAAGDITDWLKSLKSRVVKREMTRWRLAVAKPTRNTFEEYLYRATGLTPGAEDYRQNGRRKVAKRPPTR